MTDHQHESPIKTPKQLIIALAAAIIVPIVIIALLVSFVVSSSKTGKGSQGMSNQAIAARIAPVAKFEIVDASAPRVLKSGEEVFKAVCTSCHTAGVAGAPKLGDADAWAARIKGGVATLYEHAIKGYQGKNGLMPAKGGNSDLDDVEVERAVVYMSNAAGAKFKEPEAPPAPAPAQAAASAGAQPAAAPAVEANVAAAIAPANAGAAKGAPDASTAAGGDDAGKKLYNTVCMACHAAGVAGAPKFGDKAAWAPRIAAGLDTLFQHAIKGYQGKAGVMPPKGGSSASDDDVKAAVRFMVDASE